MKKLFFALLLFSATAFAQAPAGVSNGYYYDGSAQTFCQKPAANWFFFCSGADGNFYTSANGANYQALPAQGPPGLPGLTPIFNAQATMTDSSLPASATVTGSAPNFMINFTIPVGKDGINGTNGLNGTNGRDGVNGLPGTGVNFTLKCQPVASTLTKGFQTSCVILSIP